MPFSLASNAAVDIAALTGDESQAAEAVANAISVRELRALVREIRSPELIVPTVSKLVTRVGVQIEERLGLADPKTIPISYFTQPRIVARGSEDMRLAAVSDLRDLFVEVFDRPASRLPALLAADRLPEGLTFEDFVAAMFWEEIDAITTHELDPGAGARFRMLSHTGDIPQAYDFMAQHAGTAIHGLRARDSSGHWAYYHVHVEPDAAQRFLDAIAGTGNIDLKDYGTVLFAQFEHAFRKFQKDRAEAKLQGIVDTYGRVAQRLKTFSIPQPPSRAKGLTKDAPRRRRFLRAATDAQSSAALVEELATARSLVAPEPIPPHEALYHTLWPHRLDTEASSAIFRTLYRRPTSVADAAHVACALASADARAFHRIANVMRKATQMSGGAGAFDWVVSEVLGDPSLDAGALASTLIRRRPKPPGGGAWVVDDRVLSFEDPLTSDWRSLSWDEVYRDLQTIYVAGDIAGGRHYIDLDRALRAYATADDPESLRHHATAVVQVFTDISSRHRSLAPRPSEGLSAHGFRYSFNITGRLVDYMLSFELRSPSFDIVAGLLSEPETRHIGALSIIGGIIEDQEPELKRGFLRRLLTRSLRPALEAAKFPEADRERFTEELLDRLLPPQVGGEISAGVADHPGEPVAAPDQVARSVPTTGPEIARPKWSDREPGDTPVSFIRRHYGNWHDGIGNGLTRPDIRRLDRKLYQALATWERRHPEDKLDLPTKKELNDAWVDRVRSGQEELPPDRLSYLRFRGANSRRK